MEIKLRFPELIKAGSVFFVFQILGLIFGFLNVWIITRFFGVDAQGIVALLFAYIAVASVLTRFGTNVSLLRIVSQNIAENKMDRIRDFLRAVYRLIGPLGFVSSVLVYAGADFFAGSINSCEPEHLRIAALAIFPVSLLQVNGEFVRAFGKMVQYGFIQHCVSLFSIGILCVTIAFTSVRGYSVPLIIQVLSNILMCGIGIWFVFPILKTLKSSRIRHWTVKKLMKFSQPFFAVEFVSELGKWSDIIILGALGNPVEVGILYIAKRVANLLSLVFISINAPVIPKYGQLFYSGDSRALQQLIKRLARGVLLHCGV